MSSCDDSGGTQLINGLQTALLLAIADVSDDDLARKLLHVALADGRDALAAGLAQLPPDPTSPSDAGALEAFLAATNGWDPPSPQQASD